MKHFFRGGEGMSCGQSDRVNMLSRSEFPIFGTGGTGTSYRDLSSRPININDRLLSRSKFGTGSSAFFDEEDGESLRTTFAMASPLLRPFITYSSPIQHRFNTRASRILDEMVMKRCSGGNETPKLVRSRCESDQEAGDLSSFVPTDYLPFNYDVNRRVQENRKTATKTRIEKWIEDKREDVDETSQKGPDATPVVYQLSSAQVLPWFCFCSNVLRSARDRFGMRLRPSSENYRSGIEAPSEKGRTRSGLGRCQVGTLFGYLPPFARYFIASEATDRQRTGKEKANKEQGKTKQSPKKEQRIGSAFADLDKIWKGEVGHTSFGSYSPLVRGMFGKCLSIVYRLSIYSLSILYVFLREKIEKHKAEDTKFPKPVRSRYEAVPNQPRSCVEELSKPSRRGCENITFQKGAQTKVELALTQPITKDELTTSLERTNVELATTQERTKDKTRIRQESRNSTSKNIPERYCKGTGKVLNSGGKGTGEVLESYQRGTKEVLTASRSVVGYDRDGGCFGVVPTSRNGEAVVNDLRMDRLILRSFRALCKEFRTKVESMVVKENRGRQIALKQADNKFVNILPQAGSGSILFSLKPREAHTFLLDKESMQRTQGVECSPKFRSSRLNLKNSPNKLGSNSLRFYTPPDPKFLTAVHSKAGYKPFAIRIQLIATMIFMLFSGLGLSGAVVQSPQHRGVIQQQQESVLRGVVLSEVDGMPVANATISVGAKTVHSVKDGTFRIAVDKPNGSLIIKHIGYKEQSVAYDKTSTLIKVRLEANETQIEEVEVVSTGYQKLPKERATGSFVQIDNKLLNRRVSTNVLDRIEDVVPGLIFNRNNEPSAVGIASSGISIRGQSTIMGNTEPLIVVDNFPYEGNLNDINPDDVASITVLKDAAAAAIWGARAGNGVIVINTMRGKYSTPTKLSFSTNMTAGSKPDLFYQPQMSSKEFIEVERSLFKSYFYLWTEYSTSHAALSPAVELLVSNRDGKLSDNLLEKQLDSLGQIDYRDDVSNAYYRNSVNQQYALNLSGGTGQLKYVVSAGWDKNKHNLINTGYERLTFSNRNTYRMWKDRIELATDIALSKTDDRPSIPLYTPESNLPYYPYARLVDDNNEPLAVIKDRRWPFLEAATARGLLDWKYRPLEEAKIYDNLNSALQQRFNISARIKLMDFLQANLLYMYGHTSSSAVNNHSGSSYLTRNLINSFTQIDPSGKLSYPIPIGDIVDRSDATSRAQNFRAQLDFNKRWNDKSDLSAIIGAELRDMNIESSTARRYGYNTDRATFSSVNYRVPYEQYWSTVGGTSLIPYVDYETGQTDRYRSFYTNFAYTYLEKYVLSGSARLDQSNIFGVKANQKGVPLYSAGVAWNIHQEDFMQFDLFNSLKLRSSFGYNGNVYRNVSAYTTARSENQYNSANNSGLPYATIINPPYPELRWERVRVLNLGFDFAILNNRILGSVDYFSKKGIDLIGTMEMDPTVGIHSFTGNNASTSTKGLDFTLGAKIIDQRLKWTSTLLGALVKDKVTSFSREFATSSYPGSVGLPLKGRPLFGMYSYEWAGLDPNDGSPKGYLNGEVSKDYYKMMYQKSPYSLVYSGSRRPTFFGSFRNDFSWNNLSLSINLAYRLGYYYRRNTVDYTTVLNAQGGHGDYSNRWQKPGDELNTFVPSVPVNTYDGSVTFYNNADVHVRKGDHVRLQDINFSYRVLSSGKQNSVINNLDIIAYINNVGLVWTANKEGVDPDFQAGPMPRTYSLGLKIDL